MADVTLEGLFEKSLTVIEELLDSEDEEVRLGAARVILEYAARCMVPVHP